MMRAQKKRVAFKTIAAAFLIFVSIVSFPVWLLNQPFFLHEALDFINQRSDWRFSLASFRLQPFARTISIENLEITHPQKDAVIALEQATIHLDLLGFLRGKLLFTDTAVRGVTLRLPKPTPAAERRHKRWNIERLFLLQNLAIEQARVEEINATVDGKNLRLQSLILSFDHTLIGESELEIDGTKFEYRKDEELLAATEALQLLAKTRLGDWLDEPPYVDNGNGSLLLTNLQAGSAELDQFAARFRLQESELALQPVTLTKDKKQLIATINANLESRAFQGTVDIPVELAMPSFGNKEKLVFETAGWIAGEMRFHGTGFSPQESRGEAEASLAARFARSPEQTHTLKARASWQEGVLSISEAVVDSGGKNAHIDGTIDIVQKHIDLRGKGEGFPLQAVFLQFHEKDLQKIFGEADFEAQLHGWGKEIAAHITGTVHRAGWDDIAVEKVTAIFDVSRDHLLLTGDIFQKEQKHGESRFEITYSKRRPDGSRDMHLNLTGQLRGYDVGASFGEHYKLFGTGEATISLAGLPKTFSGTMDVEIDNGHWQSIAFERLVTEVGLSPKKIVFAENIIKPVRLEERALTSPVILDIIEEGFLLHGTPLEGLDFAVEHRKNNGGWHIRTVAYRDPAAPRHAFSIAGRIADEGALDVRAQGRFNLETLAFLAALFRETAGIADVDLRLSGTSSDPRLRGSIVLSDAVISPRAAKLRMENINGALRFHDDAIVFEDVHGTIDDGQFRLGGSLVHSQRSLKSARLTLAAQSLPFRSSDGSLRVEYNGALALTGDFPEPLLAGTITIIDGRYTKDFLLIDAFTKEKRAEHLEQEEIALNPQLDLHIENSGDFFINNNVGLIGLRINVDVSGKRRSPTVKGSVDVAEGEIYYLGLRFDITKGFIEFRAPYGTPYLEVSAARDLKKSNYNVTAELYGPTDNLTLDLSGTSPAGPLDKKDVISLIAFGQTETERQQLSDTVRQSQLTTQVLASQVSSIFERPVSKLARLDVVRLEASDSASASRSISRLYLSKQLSDRLSIDFLTDLNTVDAVQTFIMEYLLTDNLLMKGIRSSDKNYELRGVLRFQSR